MDYTVKVSGKDIAVEPPFYRQDIMHQVDIIDDVMRSIGVENIPSITPHSYTEGGNLQDHYSINNIKRSNARIWYL
ncbi:MAG: Phenylalanyl-tRNA synthetase beta subunit-like protein [Candidatus Parvarchaeum acidophilus ARMAN-5]|uniref:Phenylalanyl-tRNA synthetase beta subunit-like protein n=1 Tax=Candidatus Parvarchaeum acidophilus ARMAN-5 TaxID=662762 RepID=D6GWP8_PARA5|nr:MAG: Phenylalanyl-tRNA synthetase beta subunit-like protein [Candidatus Parvarchaeum acidophilus ARMAN-5]